MREIKFRVWDNEFKKMWSVAEVDTQDNKWDFSSGEIVGQIRANNFETTRLYNNFILMQFIGLKDRNGKYIYEGDIVKFRVHAAALDEDIAFVKYNEILSQFILIKKEKYIGYCEQIIEVIGNIYENPELLEKLK